MGAAVTLERVRVGEVLSLQRRAVEIDPASEYSLIGIYSFGKGIFHREPQTGASLGDYRFFAVQPGDLVLSNIQAWEGAIALAQSEESGTIGTHRFLTYVPRDERIDTGWAKWFFLSEPGMKLIRKAAPGTTIRNRTLAIDRFEALEIPLPPINEQRRVTVELHEVAAAAVRAAELFAKESALSGALAVSMTSRVDLDAAAKSAAGWAQVRLGEVLTPSRDQVRVDAGAAYPNLGIYSFGRGVFLKPDVDGSSTSATSLFRVREGQFIYSRLFAFEGAYAHVPAKFDGYFVSNEFPAFGPHPECLDTRWLSTYLRSPSRWAELAGASKGIGVRRQRVPVEAVLNHEVWLPPIEAQRHAVATIAKLEKVAEAREESEKRVDSLVRAALNAAFANVG
jgi:type I restriction enzyme S subunit